jgi:hypothetical protein
MNKNPQWSSNAVGEGNKISSLSECSSTMAAIKLHTELDSSRRPHCHVVRSKRGQPARRTS